MKIIKIAIMSRDEMQAYTKSVALGEIEVGPDSPKIFFSSEEQLRDVLKIGRTEYARQERVANMFDSSWEGSDDY